MNKQAVISKTAPPDDDTPSRFEPSPKNEVALTIPADAYIVIAEPT